MGKIIKNGVAYAGVSSEASAIPYSNTSSGLTATNVQGAIDEVNGSIETVSGSVETVEGNIETINGSITTINGNITTINGNIDTIEGDIDTIEGSMLTSVNALPAQGVTNKDADLLSGHPASYFATAANLTSQISEVKSDISHKVYREWITVTTSSNGYFQFEQKSEASIKPICAYVFDKANYIVHLGFNVNNNYFSGFISKNGLASMVTDETVDLYVIWTDVYAQS